MWYSRKNLRLLFMVSLIFIASGIGLMVKDEHLIGAVLLCIGIIAFMIRMTAIGLDAVVTYERRKKGYE